MSKRRAKTVLVIATSLFIGWCTEASADLLPPPPLCDAMLLGEPCDGMATTTGQQFEGVCMKGVDNAFYCRVGSECYPATPLDPGQIEPEPCPAEAVVDDGEDDASDDAAEQDAAEEGCAVAHLHTEATSAGLVATGLLVLLALGRRRRRTRR